MQILESTRWPMSLKFLALAGLVFALAACQPSPIAQPAPPKEMPVTATVPAATQPETPATQTLPAEVPTQQAVAFPQILAETSITYPHRLIWSLDGQRLAVHGEGGFTLLDANSFKLIATRYFQSPVFALDFSPDGKTYAISPDGKVIELYDIDSGQLLRSISPGVTFQRAVFSPDGRWLAVDSMEQMAYTLWDVASGQKGAVLSGFVTAAPIYSADFSASGNKLIWYARGTIQVMDIASGQLATAIGHEDFIVSFALKSDDSLLVTSTGGTYNGEYTPLIFFWDPQTGQRIAAYPQEKFANALAFSPDGAVLAAAIGADVLLIDPAGGQTLQTFHATDDALNALAYSPDGTRIATAGSDGHVRLWRLK